MTILRLTKKSNNMSRVMSAIVFCSNSKDGVTAVCLWNLSPVGPSCRYGVYRGYFRDTFSNGFAVRNGGLDLLTGTVSLSIGKEGARLLVQC